MGTNWEPGRNQSGTIREPKESNTFGTRPTGTAHPSNHATATRAAAQTCRGVHTLWAVGERCAGLQLLAAASFHRKLAARHGDGVSAATEPTPAAMPTEKREATEATIA